MEFVGIGLIVFGLVWASGFGLLHFRALAKAKASESWPSAMGRIAASEVRVEESTDRDSTTWYNPVVAYRYTVGGREFEGARLRFGNYRQSTRKKAEAMLARYSAGGSVPVRYNPADPAESVLETTTPGPIYFVMGLFGLLFVGFGLFWNSLT